MLIYAIVVVVLLASVPVAILVARRRGASPEVQANLGGVVAAAAMSGVILAAVSHRAERSAEEIQARAERNATLQTERSTAAAARINRETLAAERETERQRRLGAARLMQLEFDRRIVDLRATLCRTRAATGAAVVGYFPTRQTRLLSTMASEDRRAVASALTPDAWEVVVRADVSIYRAQRLLDDRLDGGRVTEAERAQLRAYVRDFARAARGLEEITEQGSTVRAGCDRGPDSNRR